MARLPLRMRAIEIAVLPRITMQKLKSGKIPFGLLEKLIASYAPPGERVTVGPMVGEDAAAIDFGEKLLIVTSDPITFATEDIGYYAVVVNSNDVAAMGGRPKWFLATVLLPEGKATDAMAEEIFAQIGTACKRFGLGLIGGHTEITRGIDRPIIAGTMIGEVASDRLVRSNGAMPGDLIVITKCAAIEGSSIIAREQRDRLLQAGFNASEVDKLKNLIYSPGISILKESEIACSVGKPSAMHDPTEGGIATGLWELASASGVGLLVMEDEIPMMAETRALCKALGLDPLGLISSGCLLITAEPEAARLVLSALKGQAINASIIGEVVEAAKGLKFKSARGEREIKPYERDEITKL